MFKNESAFISALSQKSVLKKFKESNQSLACVMPGGPTVCKGIHSKYFGLWGPYWSLLHVSLCHFSFFEGPF